MIEMRQFMYSFLTLLRNKTLIFWTLLFPLILGTLFSVAFGNINEISEGFSKIPVAVVVQGDNENHFTDILGELSGGDNPLVTPTHTNMEDAKELLSSGDVEGIFEAGETIRLIVSEQGISQSILKSISDSYLQISNTVTTVAQTRPDMVEAVVAAVYDDIEINRDVTLGTGETNDMILYYYALIAMTCMFGSYFGVNNVFGIQANKSPLAGRRCIAPTKKISMILSDFAASVILLFCIALIVLAYLIFVLGINFGDRWGLVILTIFIGSITGVSLGTFTAAVIPSSKDENLPIGILTGVSLFLCFLSGLMYGHMKYVVEQYAPIVNRLNPAALLSDAFYSLVVYDSYSRYINNIIGLLVISALFCVASAFILRRKRYADI